MDLVTVDPYEKLYKYEQVTNPNVVIGYRVHKKSDVEAVDRLVLKSRGRQEVKTESDWQLLGDIITFFADRWPVDWAQFAKAVPDIRTTRRAGGYSKSKEIKYVASLPYKLERLIKTCFPMQQFDKKFVYSLIRRYKIFKIGGY